MASGDKPDNLIPIRLRVTINADRTSFDEIALSVWQQAKRRTCRCCDRDPPAAAFPAHATDLDANSVDLDDPGFASEYQSTYWREPTLKQRGGATMRWPKSCEEHRSQPTQTCAGGSEQRSAAQAIQGGGQVYQSDLPLNRIYSTTTG